MTPDTMNPNRARTAVMVALAALVLCLGPASAATFTDDSGTTITLDGPPERIVSLSPSSTEILAALGLLDRVAGVTDVCDYPPEVRNLTRIGGYSSVSIERVAAVNPDLVIASDLTPAETVARLRGLGLTVMLLAPKSIDHVLQDIRLVGEVTGTGARADALVADLSRRMAGASGGDATDRPRVAHVVWHTPLYVSGNATMQDDIVSRSGGANAFADHDGWSTVSLEEFLRANPDIIIVSSGDGMIASNRDVILDEFTTNPQYASLSAVENGRVFAVDADMLSRPGPRVADATEEVSRIIAAFDVDRAGGNASAPGTETTRSPGFSHAVAGLALVLACGLAARVARGR